MLKTSKIDLSVIIVNYNNRDFLKNCLESIGKDMEGKRWEIIVVDNCSVDGSGEMVREFFPNVKLIENKANLGFAVANNLGIKTASGRYTLFVNPDTLIPKGTLEFMIRYMDNNPEVGAATCRVELPDGGLDQASHRGFPTPWNSFCYFSGLSKVFPKVRLFSGYSLTYLPLNTIHEIDSACGAFLIVREKVGTKVGWWDEDYFLYGEDLDFCYRIKENGWKIMFVPEVKITHFKGIASGLKKHSRKLTTATKETRLMAAMASTEVMRIFFEKHYAKQYPRPVGWLVWMGTKLLETIRIATVNLSS